jgi:hypothetical protein
MMLSVTIRSGELRQNRAAKSADLIADIAGDIATVAEELKRFYDEHGVAWIELED